MSSEDYQPLCDAIRQHCARSQWYGPDLLGPDATDDPRQFGFAFPPATTEQVRETEAVLGFSLPAVLRTLYMELANGGFGPAYGLRGIQGGKPQREGTIPEFWSQAADMFTLFDLKGNEVQPGKTFFFLYSQWPRFLIPIVDWGCGIEICIDCTGGHILRCGPWDENNYGLEYLADSLEEWLQRWMRGELYPEGIIKRASKADIADIDANPF